MTCTGLTPGATYSTPAGKFKADRQGNGTVHGTVEFSYWYQIVPDYSWFEPTYSLVLLSSDFPVDVARKSGKEYTAVLSGVFVAAAWPG